ncbi:MAG: CoA ester lyase [Gammaproteobacteria bacterium]|nr:CoA ester lyase [Gammaproteobacteria bacterium]
MSRVNLCPLPNLRSLLFVPGSREDFLPKAAAAGADALVLDLEDSVPAAVKDAARAHVATELAGSSKPLTFIRINHPSCGELEKDLAVLAPHTAQAVMLPKVAVVEDVEPVDARLTIFERDNGLDRDSISILVVIETSIGLRNLFDVLRSRPRIRGAALASAEEGDFMLDIGGRWTPTGEALTYARGKFVCDARAAGVTWIVDGAFMNLRDGNALELESHLARSHGFGSKVAIHPRQVAVINEVFSPTAEEVERARKLLEAFREAEAKGRGAVQFQGMMIDYANVRWAKRLLGLARDVG